MVPDEEHVSSIRRVFTDSEPGVWGRGSHRIQRDPRDNAWRRSGRSRYEFIALTYEARRITRLYQGKQPPGTAIVAKGAYFFTVLENLLAAQGGGAGRAPPRDDRMPEVPQQEGGKATCAD